MGKIGLVNSLFLSRSLCRNIGGPIRLLCETDVIHRNNGDHKSWAIEAVCRRLGYTGLKPDHEKAVRSFRNGQDVLRACQPWMDSLNASKIAPKSLCRWKRCFFPGLSFLGNQKPPGKTDLCNEMSQDGVIVCHSSSTLYMMSYITILRHNFCNSGERKWNGHSPDQFFPCGEKWSGNKTNTYVDSQSFLEWCCLEVELKMIHVIILHWSQVIQMDACWNAAAYRCFGPTVD